MSSETKRLRIACLGWGSLIWNPGDLPLASGWFADGPTAPVEFSRQSANGRITLVVDPDAAPQTLLWAELSCHEVEPAKQALREREGLIGRNWSQRIGVWTRGDAAPGMMPDLPAWAEAHSIDAVIWTALGPKFNDEERRPTEEELLRYLRALEGDELQRARHYIENTPPQIKTAYRKLIEEKLGWVGIQNPS